MKIDTSIVKLNTTLELEVFCAENSSHSSFSLLYRNPLEDTCQ